MTWCVVERNAEKQVIAVYGPFPEKQDATEYLLLYGAGLDMRSVLMIHPPVKWGEADVES